MSEDKLADKFKALGDPTRMRIYRCLMSPEFVNASAPTVGQIASQVAGAAKINSTISHHIKELRQAGLIDVRRQGRTMTVRPKPDGMREMLNFLLDCDA